MKDREGKSDLTPEAAKKATGAINKELAEKMRREAAASINAALAEEGSIEDEKTSKQKALEEFKKNNEPKTWH